MSKNGRGGSFWNAARERAKLLFVFWPFRFGLCLEVNLNPDLCSTSHLAKAPFKILIQWSDFRCLPNLKLLEIFSTKKERECPTLSFLSILFLDFVHFPIFVDFVDTLLLFLFLRRFFLGFCKVLVQKSGNESPKKKVCQEGPNRFNRKINIPFANTRCLPHFPSLTLAIGPVSVRPFCFCPGFWVFGRSFSSLF